MTAVARASITQSHTTFSSEVTTYQPEQIRRVIDHGLLYQSLIDECAGGRRLTVGGLGDRLVGGHMYLLIGPVLQVRLAKKLNYVPCLASQLTSTATVHRVRNGIGRYLSLNSSCTVTREVLRDPSSDVVYKRRPFLCAPQTICVSIQNWLGEHFFWNWDLQEASRIRLHKKVDHGHANLKNTTKQYTWMPYNAMQYLNAFSKMHE